MPPATTFATSGSDCRSPIFRPRAMRGFLARPMPTSGPRAGRAGAIVPPDADGLRALRFGYDPATSRDGTVVAGHPAVLTALIDKEATVAGLRIETDPKARLYLRKKAFLFGPQVKARYGSDGWTCAQAELGAGEQPVGGVHVKERCTKTTQGRVLVIERNLYRKAGQDDKSLVDETGSPSFARTGRPGSVGNQGGFLEHDPEKRVAVFRKDRAQADRRALPISALRGEAGVQWPSRNFVF